MAKRHDPILSFGVMLACAGAVPAAIGLQMLAGFVAGVIITLFAAAIAGTDFTDFD